MNKHQFISKDFSYAVIGASKDPKKYGHIVFKDLLDAGYRVTPINPKADEILGVKALPDISETDGIDVAVFVVPPEVSATIVKKLKSAGITKAWFQPGSESVDFMSYCIDKGIQCVYSACIMQERRAFERGKI